MGQYDRLGQMLSDALENGFERYKKRPEKATGQEKKQDDEIHSETNAAAKPVKLFSDTKALSVLGLTEEASEKDVKEAYRALLKKYHPDNVPDLPLMQDTAARKTREIVEAYRKLIKIRK